MPVLKSIDWVGGTNHIDYYFVDGTLYCNREDRFFDNDTVTELQLTAVQRARYMEIIAPLDAYQLLTGEIAPEHMWRGD